jgi:YidC/Oxa1 family membrane protein insertase
MEAQRLVALAVFILSGVMLWEAWQKHNAPKPLPKVGTTAAAPSSVPGTAQPQPPTGNAASNPAVPTAASTPAAAAVVPATVPAGSAAVPTTGEWISVKTDVFDIRMNTQGGDIRNVTLLKHLNTTVEKDGSRLPLQLLSERFNSWYITQTGLVGDGLPNHTSVWQAEKNSYQLAPGEESLTVRLTHSDATGTKTTKAWTFRRGSYLVDLKVEVANAGAAPIQPTAYFQFARNGKAPEGEAAPTNPFSGVTTFFGPATYTDESKFKKISFSDIEKGKQDHPKQVKDGWIGVVQHYFVGAWFVPAPERDANGAFKAAASAPREFFTNRITGVTYEAIETTEGSTRRFATTEPFFTAGTKLSMAAIPPGTSGSVRTELFVGPQEAQTLEKLAPGVKLVVDYGIFEVLARPLFWVLQQLYSLVGNWGFAIILLTILIKTVFYPLNAKAGRSMAQMKVLAPKLESLRQRYGDDRMKLNQATMELFKTEKVNPMGGCLPILVQIPVFIALYWVLLGAIELRQAPWLGWIQDLSSPDPYFVLPVLYAISMFVQTKLNPQPTDPIQAKVMLWMPVVFSIFFLFFPSGLVLYWFVQNLIGIAQQWYINRTIAKEAEEKAAKSRR